ncbi:unnamed protein product [Linum tenue]|uniref:Uncharacterized protein n=1 Tax=Linum tenue TaxID=586396 RepID=A0AAV0K2T2_9ROSI|nr:unnamed protein product [Linum tenue]
MLGSWVEIGDILVDKLTPQIAKESSYAPEDRLLRAIYPVNSGIYFKENLSKTTYRWYGSND